MASNGGPFAMEGIGKAAEGAGTNEPSASANSGRRLADGEAAAVFADLAVAAFRWDAASDRMTWSGNAAAVLDLAEDDLPETGRGFLRLLTADGAAARSAAVPPVGMPVGEVGRPAHYRVVYDLRGGGHVRRAGRIEEIGRWVADATGRALRSEGCLIARPDETAGDAPAAPVDPATGLLLRDALLSRLETTLRDLGRDRSGAAAFLVIAIDDLARINASFGYEVGDRIIATAARRIGRRMRQGDVLGHMSGHKFGAILMNCGESAVGHAAERFRDAVASEVIAGPEAEIEAVISIGAVIVPRHAGTAEAAAIRAEEALADAREAGDRRWAVYRPSPERNRERQRNLQAAEDIGRGLAEDRFLLAYQPVVDARSRAIVSYEALARLVRADGTVLSAGPLVATAERLGLVRRIDLKVLSLALADLTANPGLRLAVNASVETVTDPAWLGRLVDAVSAARSIAPRLTIEITETAAMRNVGEIIRLAEILRDLGCRIAIDDFGSGHTSFKALRAMEVDVVKIDGSFVRDITTNPDSAMFVRTLAALAAHFNIRTVAEWVQDEAAAEMLTAVGIDHLQGRHVGEPRLRLPPGRSAAGMVAEVGPDDYPAFRAVLEGPLAVEAEPAAPSAPVIPPS